MTVQRHNSRTECEEAAQAQHEDMKKAERWMGVFLQISPTGVVKVARTTQNYPRDMYEAALKDIAAELQKDINPPKLEPLPTAPKRNGVNTRMLSQEEVKDLL